jgi:hypothetical protein
MGQIHPCTPSISPSQSPPPPLLLPPPPWELPPIRSPASPEHHITLACASGGVSFDPALREPGPSPATSGARRCPVPHLQAREPGGAPSLTSQLLEPNGAPSVTSQPREPAGSPSSLAARADRMCGAGGRRRGFLPCTARRPIQLHLVDVAGCAADATPPLSQLLPIPPPRAQRRNPRRPRQGASSNSNPLPA